MQALFMSCFPEHSSSNGGSVGIPKGFPRVEGRVGAGPLASMLSSTCHFHGLPESTLTAFKYFLTSAN